LITKRFPATLPKNSLMRQPGRSSGKRLCQSPITARRTLNAESILAVFGLGGGLDVRPEIERQSAGRRERDFPAPTIVRHPGKPVIRLHSQPALSPFDRNVGHLKKALEDGADLSIGWRSATKNQHDSD
jgi:hypothetical protein